MKTIILLQARMSSSRLPGKVLKPILSTPMLEHQIFRLKRVTNVDDIIVVTSTEPSDKAIVKLCQQLKVKCFRGSLNNVLDRFYQASLCFPSDHIVRLTGDCPLIDPIIVDTVIKQHVENADDYTSNCEPSTFPDGLDVEVFTQEALHMAWNEAVKPSELEHVTPFIRLNPEKFRCGSVQHSQDLSSHRWTVDEPEDFQLIEQIFQALFPKNNHFSFQDILNLLSLHPELSQINQNFIRNEGFIKSKEIDREQGYD